jgi:hypothetical protein
MHFFRKRNTEPNKFLKTNRNQISSMRNIKPMMQVVFINPDLNPHPRRESERSQLIHTFLLLLFVFYMFSLSAIHTDNTLMVFAIENSFNEPNRFTFGFRYSPIDMIHLFCLPYLALLHTRKVSMNTHATGNCHLS